MVKYKLILDGSDSLETELPVAVPREQQAEKIEHATSILDHLEESSSESLSKEESSESSSSEEDLFGL